ncbi:MAG: glycoside hydrolase family 16 protein [Brevinematia bacterium]
MKNILGLILLFLMGCSLQTTLSDSSSSSSLSSSSSSSSSGPTLPSTNGGSFNPGTGYNLVWSDEFNGNVIDLNNWSYDTGATGWGNNEWQNYTYNGTGGENAYVTNGMLVIKAIKVGGLTLGGFTSARLKTQGKKFWKYGVFAARIALPQGGKGIWPAFWMLGTNITTVGWPACGEIDIMEWLGHQAYTVYGTLHWDENGHASYGLSKSITAYQSFHIYHAEWTSTYIKIGVDGVYYYTMDITTAGTTEFHNPFFIILNLAIGGDWPGYPDATVPFPQYLYVDWVRVYQK